MFVDILDAELEGGDFPRIQRPGKPFGKRAGNIKRRDQVKLAIRHRPSLSANAPRAKRRGAVVAGAQQKGRGNVAAPARLVIVPPDQSFWVEPR
jgi:hypothetical protein